MELVEPVLASVVVDVPDVLVALLLLSVGEVEEEVVVALLEPESKMTLSVLEDNDERLVSSAGRGAETEELGVVTLVSSAGRGAENEDVVVVCARTEVVASSTRVVSGGVQIVVRLPTSGQRSGSDGDHRRQDYIMHCNVLSAYLLGWRCQLARQASHADWSRRPGLSTIPVHAT
nr:hypothetical protein CFP56_28512 [Quercus suber]